MRQNLVELDFLALVLVRANVFLTVEPPYESFNRGAVPVFEID